MLDANTELQIDDAIRSRPTHYLGERAGASPMWEHPTHARRHSCPTSFAKAPILAGRRGVRAAHDDLPQPVENRRV